jgi:WD40 repeat protein/DNA-binding SARP family transcriptional activator
MLQLRLLGQFEVRLDETPVTVPSRPAQSLLAFLALTAGTAHRRERLAGLLWPDAGDDSARASLRQGLWRLRKALEADLPRGLRYLVADDLTVAFSPNAPTWLDVAVLEQPSEGLPSTERLRQVVAVYRGELLPGFYDDWVLRERERLEAVFERKMSDLLDRLVAERCWPDVLATAERWIAVGQVPEPAYRALMLAHSERGDQARLATVYQRCRQALFEELGATPSEQTRRLFDDLARGQRVLPPLPDDRLADTRQDGAPAPGASPYQGLTFFDTADARRFFGRDAVVARLAERLRRDPFVGLIGASGSGKSSVVRAGLVPLLKRLADGTDPVVRLLTPTAHPLESLAATVAQPGSSGGMRRLLDQLTRDPRALRLHLQRTSSTDRRTILIVDQFEELFTLCRQPFEREVFVDTLLGASREGEVATLLIAVRADFYAHCAQYPELRQALAARQEYLGPMGPDELRKAIEGPAEGEGWLLEPGLVDLLLRDVGEEPGALPLLSHALLETWHRRAGRRLSLRGYAESGGVRGAIARTAETVFRERLTAEQQVVARRVFVRLTELGEGTQDTRRRAQVSELRASPADQATLRVVLHELAEARLITLGETSVEVAHEALIREWPTLRAWLDEDRTGLRLHRQLGEAATEWARLGSDPDLLYRGTRLAQARDWAATHVPELNATERSFLEAGAAREVEEGAEREARQQRELEAVQRVADAEHQRAEEQRRASTLLRRRARALVGAMILAIGLAGAAGLLGYQARQSADAAQTSAQVAAARELAAAAVSNLELDPERSILLGLQAIAVSRSGGSAALREAEEALHRAVQASRIQLTLHGHAAGVFSAVFSPDGSRLASIDQDGTAKVWDAATGEPELTLPTATRGNYANAGIAFSPDGRQLATIQQDRAVRIWDSATGDALLTLAEQGGEARSTGGPLLALAFSPDGGRLATGATDGTARVWELSTGHELRRLDGPSGSVASVAFSPDGSQLATGGYDDNTTRIWDLASGGELRALAGHRETVQSVAFSPDGTRLATAGDTTIRVWDVASGQPRLTLFGHSSLVSSVAFDGTGTRLLSASEDGLAKVWDAETGQSVLALAGHAGGVLGAAWSPDGRRVATASRDATVRVWDASPTGGGEGPTLVGHAGRVFDVAFSPDGAQLATAGEDHSVRLWDAGTGQSRLTLLGHTDDVNHVDFSPDGTQLASASSDGTVRVWDATTGQNRFVVTRPGPTPGLGGVAWSRDGGRLAGTPGDSAITVVETDAGRPRLNLSYPAFLQSLRFSPDGTRLAGAGAAGTTVVWDAASGTTLATLDSRTTLVNGVAFSPDGRLLATTGNDGLVRLWDVQSGGQLGARSHGGSSFGVAFSPDGRRLASSSVDRTIKLWTVADGSLTDAEPLTLIRHTGTVYRVAWSPDGRWLATASRDGTSRVYSVQLEDLVALARTRVTRSLTTEECRQYLHQAACPE